MAKTSFNRYEKKYIVKKEVYDFLLHDMEPYMKKDIHNEGIDFYTICNIYYDTEEDEIIKRSVSKPEFKEKLRLRCYCNGDENSFAFLEIKKKLHGFVNKRRTTIKVREANELINDKVMPLVQPYHNEQVLNELYHYVKNKELIPRIVISYDRMAYSDKADSDVRITFDTNITSRRSELQLQRMEEDELILSDDYYLMEIKTSKAIPLWLTHILEKYDLYSSSFSKYGTEFFEHLNNNRKEDETCLNPYLISPALQ